MLSLRMTVVLAALAGLLWLFLAQGCGGRPAMGALDAARQAYAAGNYAQAAELYGRGAAQGDAEALYQLGMMHARAQGVPQDVRRAERYVTDAAEQGDTMAMTMLGYWHVSGTVVAAPDPAWGVRWLTRAAVGGDDVAQFLLGMAYRTGSGVPVDHKAATAWLLKAAAQGFPVPDIYFVQGSVESARPVAFPAMPQ